MEKLTLAMFEDFIKLLIQHDWHYEESDDIDIRNKGAAERAFILSKTKGQSRLPLWQAYHVWLLYVRSSLPRKEAKKHRDALIRMSRKNIRQSKSVIRNSIYHTKEY